MALLVWTFSAKQDIDRLYDFIAHRDGRPETADQVVRELDAHCKNYAEAFAAGSVIGSPRNDLMDDVRIFTHKRWVVLFRQIKGGIEVMRVVDGSQDFSRLFS